MSLTTFVKNLVNINKQFKTTFTFMSLKITFSNKKQKMFSQNTLTNI